MDFKICIDCPGYPGIRVAFQGASNGGIQPLDNNVYRDECGSSERNLTSPWEGNLCYEGVPQSVNSYYFYGFEAMRTYADIESCLCDYHLRSSIRIQT